jgi:hypothetical protein
MAELVPTQTPLLTSLPKVSMSRPKISLGTGTEAPSTVDPERARALGDAALLARRRLAAGAPVSPPPVAGVPPVTPPVAGVPPVAPPVLGVPPVPGAPPVAPPVLGVPPVPGVPPVAPPVLGAPRWPGAPPVPPVQSPSFVASQPPGQQPSPEEQALIVVWLHATLQVWALPVI